jgi:hypothetical protein
MILIKTTKKINNLIVIVLIFLPIFACTTPVKKIEYQEACFFKTVDGKEILICDEERMNKVKVQVHPYTKEFKICDKFQYVTEIDGEAKIETGIRCPTNSGYEIIK